MVISPSLLFAQLGSVVTPFTAIGLGAVTTPDVVAVHPFASVTVNVYVPAPTPLKFWLEPTCALAAFLHTYV